MTPDFRINNFDLLRLFAATQVLFLHSYSHLKIPFPSWLEFIIQFPGVPMFFIMSGFLISASLERNSDLKNYFKNRALRIYPGLCFCIILSVFTISIFSDVNFLRKESIAWFLAQCAGVIYSPDFISSYGFGSYHVSLWTIPVELQFYVALPIAYILIHALTKNEKHKTILISIVCLIFCVISYIIFQKFTASNQLLETRIEKLFRYSFLPHIYMFFFGVIMQRLSIYKSNFIFNKGLFWLTIYLVYKYIMPVDPNYVYQIISSLSLGVTTISIAYSAPGISEKLLKRNDISYGIYIYHGIALGVLVEHGWIKNELHVFTVFAITYLLAIFSWNFIEKPFIKRKKSVSFIENNDVRIPVVSV